MQNNCYCPECGNKLYTEDVFCPECGNKVEGNVNENHYQKPEHEEKSPIVAAVLSIIPGVGHIYIGQTTKGVVLLGSAFIVAFIALLIPFMLLYYLFIIWVAYNAYSTTEKINNGEIVEDIKF